MDFPWIFRLQPFEKLGFHLQEFCGLVGEGAVCQVPVSKVASPFPADSQPEQLFAAWTLKLAGGRQLPQDPQPIVPVRSDAGNARSVCGAERNKHTQAWLSTSV
jgi:uncharacterized protein YfaT (DUF1175 family)